MAVINTNTKALFTQAALVSTERTLSKSMEQLSTGKRINSAGDDAAGTAISTRMTQQIRALEQAVRNAEMRFHSSKRLKGRQTKLQTCFNECGNLQFKPSMILMPVRTEVIWISNFSN